MSSTSVRRGSWACQASSPLLLLLRLAPGRCRRGQLSTKTFSLVHNDSLMGMTFRGWCSATVLTLFGARSVKVRTAASIVRTHGVALTFTPWFEGATAPHAGLCRMAGGLFQCETTSISLWVKIQNNEQYSSSQPCFVYLLVRWLFFLKRQQVVRK